jgi:hypothetical protein
MPEGYDLYNAQDGTTVAPESFGDLSLYINRLVKDIQANPKDPSTFSKSMALLSMLRKISSAQRQQAANRNSPQLNTNELDDLLNGDITGLGGLGSGTLPPVTDLLGEMRLRRQAEAQQAGFLAEIIGSNVPRGAEYYPGYEPGGIADVLLGIITGKGPSVADSILGDTRRVKRTDIKVPTGQPSVGEEFGEASSLAGSILGAGKVIQ